MTDAAPRPFRVLFLCTGNSARRRIAQAILNRRGPGRFVAESAGSHPVARVNPYAIEALRRASFPPGRRRLARRTGPAYL